MGSHTLRGCVDWNSYRTSAILPDSVTPCVGVWIETPVSALLCLAWFGHTLRGCVDWNLIRHENMSFTEVTPCVGVWIETYTVGGFLKTVTSHTLRGCVDWNSHVVFSRWWRERVTPCVGVWIETALSAKWPRLAIVTPCVGVWIETAKGAAHFAGKQRHTLRGCVDWNKTDWNEWWSLFVTPCVGVWIET